jgi:uncharacterized protein (TIGR00369 family)
MPSPTPERRAYLAARAATSRLAGTTGYRVRFDGDTALLDLPYNAALDNGAGAIHGGILCVLVDTAGWYAVALQTEGWPATIELQTRFLAPAACCDLTASARLVRVGKRLATAEVDVRTADGTLVATGTATYALGLAPRVGNELRGAGSTPEPQERT